MTHASTGLAWHASVPVKRFKIHTQKVHVQQPPRATACYTHHVADTAAPIRIHARVQVHVPGWVARFGV